MSEQRLAILEQRVDHIHNTVERTDSKVDGIAETLQSLARIEERQMSTTERLRQGAETFSDHEERLRKLEIAMPENLSKRLSAIEVKMPGLIESRRWVVMGVLAGVGMIGIAVVHLVMKG